MTESLLSQVALNDARAGNDMAATVEFKRGQLLPQVVVWGILVVVLLEKRLSQ